MSKPTGAGRNSKSPSILQAGSPLHTASSASLIHSPKPIKPAHAATLRSSQRWPLPVHGNHPEHTPMLTRRHSSALKPNSKRSSRYQATRSEKKALNFIPSLSSLSPKNTGGTRARRTNSDRKRIEGGFFKLGLIFPQKCNEGICGRRLLGVGRWREGKDKSHRKAGEGWGRGLHGDLGSCDF